jgi:hypothetical protein
MYLRPKSAPIPVLIGFNFNESLIIWLFNPALRFDPPTKIILGDGSLSKRESFFTAEKREDLKERGVGGNEKRNTINKIIVINVNALTLIINFLIFLKLKINKF